MYSFTFIFSYITVIMVIGMFTIISFRRFIITYRIFGRAKKRDYHKQPIPNSIGVVFLLLFILGSIVLESFFEKTELTGLIAGGVIICLTGFWDDLKIMSPYRKLFYQIFAVSFIVLHNGLVIQNLYGFLGIEILNPILGIPFTVFIGVFMINAFNLIDGIDGLAGMTSIISFAAFAIVFWVLDSKGYFGICFLMIGIISSYLPFNFSKKRKVFMGDSGSMFIGFILFVMSMLIVNSTAPILDNLPFDRAIIPIAPLTIFILPIIDTASIYLYRLSVGRSPFSADKYHIHHLILLFTKSHLISSLVLSCLLMFTIFLFSSLIFKSSMVFFISLYFVLVFSMILLTNIIRIIFKKQLNRV
jgi:UDP-GlcNAc:undecaprenyl-phosphate GlcNAc-1-phosphate transferase